MGRKKRKWAKWRARQEEKKSSPSYGKLVAESRWDEERGEAIVDE